MIAANWNDVAIEFGYSPADNFAPFVNLVKERFRQMLHLWLTKNKAKKRDDIFTEFQQALLKLRWNRDAEYFSDKVEEYKQNH